jgi:hypothetical protein
MKAVERKWINSAQLAIVDDEAVELWRACAPDTLSGRPHGLDLSVRALSFVFWRASRPYEVDTNDTPVDDQVSNSLRQHDDAVESIGTRLPSGGKPL